MLNIARVLWCCVCVDQLGDVWPSLPRVGGLTSRRRWFLDIGLAAIENPQVLAPSLGALSICLGVGSDRKLAAPPLAWRISLMPGWGERRRDRASRWFYPSEVYRSLRLIVKISYNVPRPFFLKGWESTSSPTLGPSWYSCSAGSACARMSKIARTWIELGAESPA